MKPRRIILKITTALIFISLILIEITSINTKINNILIGIFGSSLLAFLVELPNTQSEKQKLKDNLYYNLFYLYMGLLQYKWWIEKALNENIEISEDFNKTIELNIENNSRMIMFIDNEMFYDKKKNEKLDDLKWQIKKLADSFWQVQTDINIEVKKVKIKNNDVNKKVFAEDLKNILTNVKIIDKKYIEMLDQSIDTFFDKKQKEKWNCDIDKIKKELDKYEDKMA